MRKGQLPLIAELTLGDTEDFTPKARRKFSGTDNPRDLRAISALMIRPRRREELDRIVGASNSPDLVFRLREQGLAIPCERVPAIDRDGTQVKPGVYSLTNEDRRAINAWLRKQEAKGQV